jgi:hypothetical protein
LDKLSGGNFSKLEDFERHVYSFLKRKKNVKIVNEQRLINKKLVFHKPVLIIGADITYCEISVPSAIGLTVLPANKPAIISYNFFKTDKKRRKKK